MGATKFCQCSRDCEFTGSQWPYESPNSPLPHGRYLISLPNAPPMFVLVLFLFLRSQFAMTSPLRRSDAGDTVDLVSGSPLRLRSFVRAMLRSARVQHGPLLTVRAGRCRPRAASHWPRAAGEPVERAAAHDSEGRGLWCSMFLQPGQGHGGWSAFQRVILQWNPPNLVMATSNDSHGDLKVTALWH